MRRNAWIQESYVEVFDIFKNKAQLIYGEKGENKPKVNLLKLIEFNKIALLEKSTSTRENNWWCTASDPA